MKKIIIASCVLAALTMGCIFEFGPDAITEMHTGLLTDYEFVGTSSPYIHILTFEDTVIRVPRLMNQTIPLNVTVTLYKWERTGAETKFFINKTVARM